MLKRIVRLISFTLMASIALLGLFGCKRISSEYQTNLHTATKKELEKWKATQQDLLALKSYVVIGKFAYNDGKRGGSADVRWQQQQPGHFVIEITPPLGVSSVRIVATPGNISLMKQTGEMAVAKTPEELLAKTVNWNFPVSNLQYWARGASSPGKEPTKVLFNSNHELAQVEQEGWTIHYLSYMNVNGFNMPEKINLINGPVKLKLIFRQWEFSGRPSPVQAVTSQTMEQELEQKTEKTETKEAVNAESKNGSELKSEQKTEPNMDAEQKNITEPKIE